MTSGDPSWREFSGTVWRVIHRSGLLVPLSFVAIMIRFAPISSSHEFDPDEGVNLIKALLVSKGYGLYTAIWSDQPPLLTMLLAQWLRWFGTSVASTRVLTLLFSGLLLWAFYQTVRRMVSEPAALGSLVLLLLSRRYISLSISVMVGLPAIALAMLSLYLLVLGQGKKGPWLAIAAAIVFALSMQTKLFTAVLLPAILVYICFLGDGEMHRVRPLRQCLYRSALWFGVLVSTFIVTSFLFGPFDPQQLIAPHVSRQVRTAFAFDKNLAYIADVIVRHAAYLPLALVGSLWTIKRRSAAAFLPLGWLVAALAFLLYEKPLWYHHTLLMTVPLSWLSAFGIEAGIRAYGRRDHTRKIGGSVRLKRLALLLTAVIIAGLVVFDPVLPGFRLSFELQPLYYNERIVSRLCPAGRSKPAWVFSDRPMYAFQAGLSMPPPIAALTRKRFLSGTITDEMLLDVLRTYRPEYVLLERFFRDYSQEFVKAVGEDYELLEDYYYGPILQGQLLALRAPNAGSVRAANHDSTSVLFDSWLSLEWTPALLGNQVEAGNCLQLRGLRWLQPGRNSDQALGISIRLADKDGKVLAQHDESLGSDFNTLRDRAQMPYFVNFLIPEGTAPGIYDLLLIAYDASNGRPLSATGEAAVAADHVVLGQVRVDRPTETLALRRPLADFGPVRLVEAATPATILSPGNEVPLSLLWQADTNLDGEELVVVVQLLDDQGRVVAGLEEEPLNGRYPSGAWKAGELVRDFHTLSIPAHTPSGQYDLIVGLYKLPTRERMRTRAGLFGSGSRDYFSLRHIVVH